MLLLSLESIVGCMAIGHTDRPRNLPSATVDQGAQVYEKPFGSDNQGCWGVTGTPFPDSVTKP
jgi:hypothetical protein